MPHINKVYFIVGSLGRGGVEVWFTRLITAWRNQNISFVAVVFGEQEGVLEPVIEGLGVEILRVGRGASGMLRLAFVMFEQRCRGCNVILHSNLTNGHTVLLSVARLLGITALCHVHNTTSGYFGLKRSVHFLKFRVLAACEKLLANRIIGCTQAVLEDRYGTTNSLMKVVRYGLDLEPLEQIKETGTVVRESRNILVVGRLTKQKNQLFALRLHQRIMRREPNVKMILLGEGEDGEELRSFVSANGVGGVEFAGSRSDVLSFVYAHADLFLMPSFFEGLPVAALEAQLLGIPSLLSMAVPEEARLNCVPSERMSLDCSLDEWADAAVRLMRFARAGVETALGEAKARGWGIAHNVSEFENLYHNEDFSLV